VNNVQEGERERKRDVERAREWAYYPLTTCVSLDTDHFLVTLLEQHQVSNMNGTRDQELRVGGNGGDQESTVKGNSLDRRL